MLWREEMNMLQKIVFSELLIVGLLEYLTAAPAPPISATVTSISTHQIELTVNFNPGDRTSFTVELSDGVNLVSTGSTTTTLAADNQFIVPISSDLVPGRQYTVRVKTVSGNEFSTAVQATGKNTVPLSDLTTVSVTSISTTHIGLSVFMPKGHYDNITADIVYGQTLVSTGVSARVRFLINPGREDTFYFPISPLLIPGRQYSVKVTSMSGSVSSNTVDVPASRLTKVDPAQPTSITVSSITTTQITVNVQLPQGDYDGITVELYNGGSTESSGSSSRQVFSVVSSEQKVYTIDLNRSLVPGRQYSVRVKSMSGTEESSPRDAAGRSTVRPSTPVAVSMKAITTLSVTLEITFGTGEYSGIKVELHGTGEEKMYMSQAVSNTGSVTKELTVNGLSLTAGNKYSVKVQAQSSGNEVSDQKESSNSLRIVPSTPTIESVEALTGDMSIRVVVKKGPGITPFILVRISRGPDWSRETRLDVQNNGEAEHSFGQLESGNYHVTAKSQSGNLNSTTSSTRTVLENPPVSITVKSRTSRSLGLNWRREDLNVKGFRLVVTQSTKCLQEIYLNERNYQRNLSNNGCPKSSLVFEKTTTDISYNITQLLPYTLYGLAIYIKSDGILEKPEPSTLLERTETEVPSKLNITHVSVDGSRNATVCWTRPDPFPGPTEYMITVVDQGDPKLQDISSVLIGFNQTCKNLSDLEEFWPYSVKVLANTSAGDGPVTESIVFRTNESVPGDATNFMVNGAINDPFKVNVIWSPPSPRDRNANITGFQLTVEDLTDKAPKVNRSVPWSMGSSYVLNVDVVPEKLYNFTIISVGVEFLGEKNSYEFNAPAGIPSKLSITHVSVDGSRNATVCWTRPDPFPGPIEYMITVVDQGDPKLQDISSVLIGFNQTCKKLSGLEEFWPYSVKVLASTSAGDGPVTESIVFRTKESVPGLVRGFIVANVDNSPLMASVQWQAPAPRDRNANITGFILTVQTTEGGVDDVNNISFPWSKDSTLYSHTINVVPEKKYHFTISARSLSFVGTPYMYEYLAAPQPVENQNTKNGSDIGLIVGLCCGIICVLILTVVVVFVLRKRRLRTRQKVPTYAPDMNNELSDFGYPTSIPVKLSQFISRIEEMHKNDNSVFSEQYLTLEELSPNLPVTAASQKLNRKKNRNTEVLPFDKTRVKLLAMVGQDGSDYINASYIPGYNFKREYIASQGPLLNTINDFWRMVWEQQIQIILMLTNLKETESEEVYWPKEGFDVSLQYGDIIIETVSTSSLRSCFLREFKISKGSSVRHVKQFQLVKWPDYGISAGKEMAIFLREFRNNISPEMTEPILVHCSDGAGRTGTLIALDQICQSICDPLAGKDISIDIYNIVLTMRQHRARMVQTEAQYVFIHNTLCEILLEKRKNSVHIYSNDAFSDYESLYEIADMDTIKVDKTRVKLLAMVGQDGSDYINASYIPGYNFKREYIASQGPLLNTINDFWRMVWEQQIQIILMLTNLKETESEEVYWPKEGFDVSLQYGDIIIETVSTSSLRSCFLREFKISKGSSVRHVKQFQLVKWPDYGISAGKEMAIFLREFRNNISPEMTEPILVHCSDGAGRTGTLIALDQICQSICDPLAGKDISIDIYNIVLTMRQHRARMVQTEAQYVFIHNTLCEILLEKRKNSVHIYSNDAFSDYESLYEIADMDTIKENEYDTILKNQPDLPK